LKNISAAGCWWLTLIILAIGEAEIGRIAVQGQPWQIVLETPISKISRAKRIGGMVQVVEHLLYKHKALDSNLCPTKKRNSHFFLFV
jgi:hypothetical protein